MLMNEKIYYTVEKIKKNAQGYTFFIFYGY